jgi:hypothetical protein
MFYCTWFSRKKTEICYKFAVKNFVGISKYDIRDSCWETVSLCFTTNKGLLVARNIPLICTESWVAPVLIWMHEVHRTNLCRHEGKAKNETPRGDLKILCILQKRIGFHRNCREIFRASVDIQHNESNKRSEMVAYKGVRYPTNVLLLQSVFTWLSRKFPILRFVISTEVFKM